RKAPLASGVTSVTWPIEMMLAASAIRRTESAAAGHHGRRGRRPELTSTTASSGSTSTDSGSDCCAAFFAMSPVLYAVLDRWNQFANIGRVPCGGAAPAPLVPAKPAGREHVDDSVRAQHLLESRAVHLVHEVDGRDHGR